MLVDRFLTATTSIKTFALEVCSLYTFPKARQPWTNVLAIIKLKQDGQGKSCIKVRLYAYMYTTRMQCFVAYCGKLEIVLSVWYKYLPIIIDIHYTVLKWAVNITKQRLRPHINPKFRKTKAKLFYRGMSSWIPCIDFSEHINNTYKCFTIYIVRFELLTLITTKPLLCTFSL